MAPTDAAASNWAGLHCLQTGKQRGIFVISRAANGQHVCTNGDAFHAWVISERLRFASLSQPTSTPHVHWIDLGASAIVREPQAVELSLALVETLRRDLGTPEAAFDLGPWLRTSVCSWRSVTRNSPVNIPPAAHGAAASDEPACGTLPRDGVGMGYVSLREPSTCDGGSLCIGNAFSRLLNTSTDQRYHQRAKKGFSHVLKPLGCRMRLFEEADVTRCLAGKRVINMGSDIAVDIQRGFGRLNASLYAWTRRRPGTAAEQRKKFSERLPSQSDFVYQFERTGGFNGRGPDVMAGLSRFGAGSLGTQFLQHPPHYGLATVIEPESMPSKGRVGFRSAAEYERFMCRHDMVIFESGLADVAMAFNAENTFAASKVRAACAGATPAACEAALSTALQGEDWRRKPLETYRRRLRALVGMWQRCKARRPSFRAVFKLAPAPRARMRPAECGVAQWGFSVYAHHLRAANALAREEVAAAGFDVFDGFGITLHADARWFDDVRYGVKYKIHESEAVSDVTTQALLNQLCPSA